MQKEVIVQPVIVIDSLDQLENSVLSGIFPYIRVMSEDKGIIVSAKKTGKHLEKIRAHWRFVRHKIEKELPPGKYLIECAYDSAKRNIHPYEFTKPVGFIAPNEKPVVTQKTELDPQKAMSLSTAEIMKLVKENAELSAENKWLLQMNADLSKKLQAQELAMSTMLQDDDDTPELSEVEKIGNALNNIIPQAIPMLDRWFDLQEKKIMIQGGGNPPQQKTIPRTVPVQQDQVYAQQYNALNELFNQGQDEQANEILSQIAAQNPALYNRLCQDLDLMDA